MGLAPNIPPSSFVGKRLKLVLFSREVFARQNALHVFQTESNEGGTLPSLRPQASLHYGPKSIFGQIFDKYLIKHVHVEGGLTEKKT